MYFQLLKIPFPYLFAVICIGCATYSGELILISEIRAYNYYYPTTANDNRSHYRKWFDTTFFRPEDTSALSDEQRTFRLALTGDRAAIHSFFNNQYREEPGEFSVVWVNQVLLLLITLGDKLFVKYLLLEDIRTQRIVLANLRALTMRHPDVFASFFPETDRLLRVPRS
jgi:hypothetical protein